MSRRVSFGLGPFFLHFFKEVVEGTAGAWRGLRDKPTNVKAEGWRDSEWSGEDYSTLIRRPCLFQGSVCGDLSAQPGALCSSSWCQLPAPPLRPPPLLILPLRCEMCPQSFSCTPHHTMDLQQQGLAKEQRDGREGCVNLLPLFSGRRWLQSDREAQWRRRNSRLTHLFVWLLNINNAGVVPNRVQEALRPFVHKKQ